MISKLQRNSQKAIAVVDVDGNIVGLKDPTIMFTCFMFTDERESPQRIPQRHVYFQTLRNHAHVKTVFLSYIFKSPNQIKMIKIYVSIDM